MVELLNVKHFARLLATSRVKFILPYFDLDYCIYLPIKKRFVGAFPYSFLYGSKYCLRTTSLAKKSVYFCELVNSYLLENMSFRVFVYSQSDICLSFKIFRLDSILLGKMELIYSNPLMVNFCITHCPTKVLKMTISFSSVFSLCSGFFCNGSNNFDPKWKWGKYEK